MSKKEELVEQKANLVVPSYLTTGADKSAGFLDDDSDITSPPRIKVINAQSRDLDAKDTGKIYLGAQDTVVDAPILFVPIKVQKEWMDFDDDLNVKWRTTDPDDQRIKGDPDGTWKFRSIHVLVMAPVEHAEQPPELQILSFRSTSAKTGKQFYSQAKARRVPLFAQKYEMSTVEDKNAKGEWMTPRIQFRGYLDEANYAAMLAVYKEWATVALAPEVDKEEAATPVDKDIYVDGGARTDGNPPPF